MSLFLRDGAAKLQAAREAMAAALPVIRDLMRVRSGAEEVDALGGSPRVRERLQPFLDWLYERWLPVEASGFEALPAEGPILLVANRAGRFPWDALLLAEAARRHGRELRPLAEDRLIHLPYLGLLANRLGLVPASPENAMEVLGAGGAAAVFPEGAGGYGRPRRQRLQRFGRGGFVRLALRSRAQVLPVAIIGPEETLPLIGTLPWPPRLPFRLPWLGPWGPLPLPFPWRIRLGAPLPWEVHPREAAQDEALVTQLRDEVRQRIEEMLGES